MTQAELQKVLRAADPAAVLVSARILERVIREDYRLPNMHWNIPHYKSYVCDRQLLFRHAEQADLELESDQLLPDTVILLVRPDAEEMSNLERSRLLLKYWRRLFHSRVHVSLGQLHAEGQLADQDVRERIEGIGRTEFEEVREVLNEDHWLPPAAGDREIYVEFASVYLEMRQFAASLLPNYFPGIRDFGKVEQLLGRDIDSADLFERTRLKGAADPVQPVDARADESQEVYWALVRSAQKSANDGNLVGASILRMRASRVAPAALTLPTRQEAEKDIAQLSKRLGEALALTEAETGDWARHLTLLFDKADQGARPMEARVLEELLKVCMDHEQEIYTLDVVEYLLSAGKRPIKRPLPSQRMVRVAKHLRSAASLLGTVRLSDADRNHLARLMQQALRKTEEGLRTRFRPVLMTAMEDVGLRPNGSLEQAAFEKMVAELLDRINNYGFVTFAELRDTISRNQLKLPDLTEPEDFIKGDALIRLDRRLGSLLDGVYRPGEFYVRWLERFTSVNFGTWWGRLLTRFVTAPLLLGWVTLVLLALAFDKADHYLESPGLQLASEALRGPLELSKEIQPRLLPNPVMYWWHGGLVLAATFFWLALLQSASFRRRCVEWLESAWGGLRFVFWELPLRLVPLETLQRALKSWLFQMLWWYLIKPAALAAFLTWLWWGGLAERWYAVAALYGLLTFLLNSRIGRASAEAVQDAFVSLARMIRGGLLPGLLRFILFVFKQIIEAIEYLVFVADEWLRFRNGDSRASLFVRTVASVVWAPVAFLIRFFLVVLIEPGYNPLKAPVSYLAAKVMLPVYGYLWGTWLLEFLSPVKEYPVFWWPAYLVLAGIIWHLCDVFGYLFWEMKENWRLFRANRGKAVGPAAIGSHGETVRGLLEPGFHSGTVPRLYAKLRAAERRAVQTRNWDKARSFRHEIEEVAASVGRFVDREMLMILKTSRAWQGQAVSAGPVSLSTNRIRLELEHLDHPAEPVEIEVEHHQGWLVAGITTPGWLETLKPEQRRVFAACLAYLYKRADVDFAREQIKRVLGSPTATWQLTEDELVIWRSPEGPPATLALKRDVPPEESTKEIDQLLFSRAPLSWQEWDRLWQWEFQGEATASVGPMLMPPTVIFPAGQPADNGEPAPLPHSVKPSQTT